MWSVALLNKWMMPLGGKNIKQQTGWCCLYSQWKRDDKREKKWIIELEKHPTMLNVFNSQRVGSFRKVDLGDNLGWSTDTAGDPRADLSRGRQEVAAKRLKRPGTGAAWARLWLSSASNGRLAHLTACGLGDGGGGGRRCTDNYTTIVVVVVVAVVIVVVVLVVLRQL